MLINWLFLLFVPHWVTLIRNPTTKEPSGKSLFAAISFVVGIGGAVAAITADILEHRPVDKTAILLLLGNGAVLAGMKVYQSQANRRTADEEGNPLAVPPPAVDPPQIMPQEVNPNATNAESPTPASE